MFAIGWGANQFVSLLVAYRERSGLSVGTVDALVGAYALGLIPALLVLGSVSDRSGRAPVLRGAALVSLAATAVLMVDSLWALYAGRLLAGLASGAAFAAGSAWVEELSAADPSAPPGSGARRAAMALTAGFGLGPVVAEQGAALALFTAIGFSGEALLRDHIRDREGRLRDLMVLAHHVGETWSGMDTVGVADELGEPG